jgi:hypothetical protein
MDDRLNLRSKRWKYAAVVAVFLVGGWLVAVPLVENLREALDRMH